MIRRIVLLPEPVGPSGETSSPAGTSNETPSTTLYSPNRFERFFTTMPTSASPDLIRSVPFAATGPRPRPWKGSPAPSARLLVRFHAFAEHLHADQHHE